MASRLRELIADLNERSQEEPLVIPVVFLFVIFVICAALTILIFAVKVLGILFIPVVSVVGAIVMVLYETQQEEDE